MGATHLLLLTFELARFLLRLIERGSQVLDLGVEVCERFLDLFVTLVELFVVVFGLLQINITFIQLLINLIDLPFDSLAFSRGSFYLLLLEFNFGLE